MNDLPWTKREIIDALIAEYQPRGDWSALAPFAQLRALRRLALSNRAPLGFGVGLAERFVNRGPYSLLEQEVYGLLGRVWQALHDGRDPDAAYDEPLRGEMQ
jgi:hypothetical protein